MKAESSYPNDNTEATVPSTDYVGTKTAAECGTFQIFWVA